MADPESEVVLVLTPSSRDTGIACRELVTQGLECESCEDVSALCARLRGNAGVALISEELLEPPAVAMIAGALAGQPAWSDFPILVASRGRRRGKDSAAHLAMLGNVTLLDSPLRLRTLVQAVRSALRARVRQYDARRAIARRDQFLAMLGHELRNPLSSIALAGEQIELDEEVPSPPVTILRRQTKQLTRLVDDLLDVARVSTGKLELSRTRFDLVPALSDWVEAFRPRFEAAGVTLEHDIAGEAMVWGDAARLEQTFGNLLANCVKYTPRGGHVSVRLTRARERVRVEIVDDGVGIAADMLPHVFEQFVQVERNLDRAQGGMGVGLTLVRTLVERHGGTVSGHSEGLDRGSRFVVELPVVSGVARPTGVAAEGKRARTARTLVLVEDNEDARVMLAMALERLGHRVVQAVDGPEGLERILALRPDAAIIDIGLPGLSGYDVARAVRQRLGRSVALVAATGYGQPEDRARAIDAGFDVHVTKPAKPTDIEACFERLLAERTAAS